MICPGCHNQLIASTRQSVEIDYCPVCRGVWLDNGELEKIIERSNPYGSISQSHDDHDDHAEWQHDHESHGGKRKDQRKGFLADLFDF